MKTKIVRIGNSQGVRIPKPLLEEAGLLEDVELRLVDGTIVLQPLDLARVGWAEAAAALGAVEAADEDDPFLANDFDETEWTW